MIKHYLKPLYGSAFDRSLFVLHEKSKALLIKCAEQILAPARTASAFS